LGQGELLTLKSGYFQRSASTMETVADWYGIPTIHFGVEVARLEKEGKLIFTARTAEQKKAAGGKIIFTDDGVHPTIPAGHEIYRDVLIRSLQQIETAGASAKEHALPEPMRADNYQAAKLIDPAPEMLVGEWKALDVKKEMGSGLAKWFSTVYKADRPGTALVVKFKGTTIGIFDVVGPESGRVLVSVDGKPPVRIDRFSGYNTYRRQSYFLLPILPAGEHTVRFENSGEMPDKEAIFKAHKGGENVADFKAHPEKYSDMSVYVGKVMLIGDVLK
jgi:hypothetical protein